MSESERPVGSPGFEPRFEGVLELLRRLRGPDGCPWDREQTPRSLLPYLIEEAHEVAHAIEAGDDGATADELGDLLLPTRRSRRETMAPRPTSWETCFS
ncbi:MAG TPA: MazG nucleotide pyrophosphohydrolase domain-containing protein, partial [Gemmatimonadota bacterium]|nr:MazG nucleotide pyrophosphohydrolase domain-containing protein [Gemmatimonadota bacterium]